MGTQLKNINNDNIFPLAYVEDIARQADDILLQSLLDDKANLESPSFTGTPIAPTPLTSSNSTQIATTQFVKNQDYITATSLNGFVKNPTWNGTSYILTLPIQGGTTLVIDLPIEGLLKGLSYDDTTQSLILTLEDGSTTSIPIGDLVVGMASETFVTNAISTFSGTLNNVAFSGNYNDLSNRLVGGSGISISGGVVSSTLTKSDIGLGNVDNTSDLNKPISTATQTALNLKANQATTYTKLEVDGLIPDVSEFITETEVDAAIATAITDLVTEQQLEDQYDAIISYIEDREIVISRSDFQTLVDNDEVDVTKIYYIPII